MLDVIERVLQSPQSSLTTREYSINAVMKLSTRCVRIIGKGSFEYGAMWSGAMGCVVKGRQCNGYQFMIFVYTGLLALSLV